MNSQNTFSDFGNSQFIDRYEVLRLEASKYFNTRENCGLGLGAFLHRGMFTWMKCWQQCQPPLLPRESEKSDAVEIGIETRQEVVTVITNMILSHQFGRDEHAKFTA